MAIKRQIVECTCDFCHKNIKPTDYCYKLTGFNPEPNSNPSDAIMALFNMETRYDNYMVCSECLGKLVQKEDNDG